MMKNCYFFIFLKTITLYGSLAFAINAENVCQKLLQAHANPKEIKNLKEIDSFLFNPNYKTIGKTIKTVTLEEIKKEIPMYSATPEFAKKHGGPITRGIIKSIPKWYYKKAKELGLYPNIDIRVHKFDLKKIPKEFDLYPAIPGWHVDGEYRKTYTSQPDLRVVPTSFHIISTISTHPNGVSNTQFLKSSLKIKEAKLLPDLALWNYVHKHIEGMKNRVTTDIKDGSMLLFDGRSLHRAMPVKRSGWRMFFRMSMWHKPNIGEGQISQQDQVYLLPKSNSKKSLNISQEKFQDPEIIGNFKGVEDIATLAKEQSIFGASIAQIQKMVERFLSI